MTLRHGLALISLLAWAACDDEGGPARDATFQPADGGVDARQVDAGSDPDAALDGTTDGPTDPDVARPADVSVDVGADGPGDAGGDLSVDASPDAGGPPPLYDLEAIADADTADCRFERPRQALRDGVLLDVWDLTYVSWELRDGALVPIRMRGFAARPTGEVGLPGVVQSHGLGGFSEERHATGLAARLGMFVAVYTGPGGGTEPGNTSEGLPAGHDDGRRMFDTVPDVRGSWFWAHALAAMRALTCVEHHPDVDPERLGMTGFSAGGVATLISAGVDPRIRVAVPLSASGAWREAVRSPDAWQHGLLTLAGLTTESPRWLALTDTLDPARIVAETGAAVLMVNGTTDEFFPLTAHVATYDGIPGAGKRTALAANFDHGCYALTGVESAENIESRADIRAGGGQRMWFRHHFETDPEYRGLPAAPTLRLDVAGAVALAVAEPGAPGPGQRIEHVHYWWSSDAAFLFGSVELHENGGVWSAPVPAPTPDTVYYVDVEYGVGSVIAPQRFALSSRPHIPEGFVPRIRGQDDCL